MKRSLLFQMRHEWRNNIWMIIELTVVSVIIWFLFSSVLALFNSFMEYRGYETDDLYMADIKVVDKESSLYEPYDSLHSPKTDVELLVAHLKSNPNVEVVGVGRNIVTYNYNYYGNKLCLDSLEYHGNVRTVTPDVIRAYRLAAPDGTTTEQLAKVIERGDVIITTTDFDRYYPEVVAKRREFVGNDVFFNGDSARVRHVAAISYPLRRTDYEPSNGVIFTPLEADQIPFEMIIRVAHGRDREFKESITTSDKRMGNVYLSKIRPFSEKRDEAHKDINILIRSYLICVVFLLIVIFLGFLGTFWFRTQERVDEIAVRIVNGASRRDIFRRFIGEGMLLLGLSTLIVIPIELLVVHYEVLSGIMGTVHEVTLKSVQIYQSMVLTTVLLIVLILAGIWFPARRAMNVNPAEALKDQ